MFFLYKTKKLMSINGHSKTTIELYDFILGKITRIIFDNERFISVEQQLLDHLKDVKTSFELKMID